MELGTFGIGAGVSLSLRVLTWGTVEDSTILPGTGRKMEGCPLCAYLVCCGLIGLNSFSEKSCL